MYSSRGGINSMNDSKAERGGEKENICLREPNGGFWWGKRALFDSSEQNSDSPVRRCDWFSTQHYYFRCVPLKKKKKKEKAAAVVIR